MQRKRSGWGAESAFGLAGLPMDCQSHKYFASAPSGLSSADWLMRPLIDREILLKRGLPRGTYASFGMRRPNLDWAVAVTRVRSRTALASSPVPFGVRP